ncbi:MAG: helix-turn-helix domain-containing protein [Bacteroidaceae bacterium]|nr:helix-turn-helix domain-containing protein [Bacteroidaceae bacterium]
MATRNESSTPWSATHPGTILKYELEARELSQKDFAVLIGMQKSHVSELIKGKRPMTIAVADKIEEKLGISAVSLVNLQTQYDYDIRIIEQKSIEEQKAINTLKLYNEIFDINTIFKRCAMAAKSPIAQLSFLIEKCLLAKPAELKLEANGMFKKSAKTGQDTRMLMTWKILAERKARIQKIEGIFKRDEENNVIEELKVALHKNQNTEDAVKKILSQNGIAFCIEEKVEKASVDGYSYIEKGIPYIILTKRYNRIDNFAFALMHEIGHIYLHYLDEDKNNCKLSIPDYDNESPEEREANEYASNALISNHEWKNAPKVRVNPIVIQRKYTEWASNKDMNKWIVLGRISYETGMYKFKSDESRKIG